MSHRKGIEALDRTLKDIRSNDFFMGKVSILFAGDFRQTLPVVPRGSRADEIHACLKSSYLWPKISTLSLSKNMRVHLKGDSKAGEFADLLLKIGDGSMVECDGKIDISISLATTVKSVGDLIAKIYPHIIHIKDKSVSWFRERAILTPKNDSAAEINDIILNSFHSDEIIYRSVDSVINMNEAVNYPVEFLNSLNPPGMPVHHLKLKVGAPIMLLRNLKPPKLCNGTRLQVTKLYQNVVEATIFTGCAQGESVFIPRIPLIPSDYPFEFKRLQFPIKVCFAMTINKSQGQSLKEAGIDLRDNCFSHGQLYVACSRVSTPSSLFILAPDNKVSNIVYKEALAR